MSANNAMSVGPEPNSKKALAASGGALITSLFVTPLDVAKVRLQAQLNIPPSSIDGRVPVLNTPLSNAADQCRCRGRFCPCNRVMTRRVEQLTSRRGSISTMRISCSTAPVKLLGTTHALRHILATEGLRGLFAGLLPTILIAVPSTVVYYVSYDMLLLKGRERLNEYEFILPLLAGSSARVFAASLTSPLELVRTRIQNSAGRDGIVETFSRAVRANGYSSLMRGLGATLARDVPFSAVYWTSYESSQRIARDSHLSRGQRALLCGAVSGAVAATLTTPFDVVKTLQQVDSPSGSESIPHILRRVVRSGGIQGAFTGLGARLSRVVPSCAIMISCYELGKEHLGIE